MKKLFIIMTMLLSTACSVVGPGQKGVHTRFGNPSGESTSGLTFWLPVVYGITKFDLRVQKSVIEATSASKDLQPLLAHLAVNWRIDASDLTKFYKDVGDEDDAVNKIITPAVNEVFKSATAMLTAEEIVSRRIELKKIIDERLEVRLKRYGLHCDDVSIVDIKFSEDFIKAIEQKQIAEQQTKQAEYQAQKATMDAKAAVNKAKGEAESNLMLAKAQAESQKLLQQTVSPAILQLKAIEKWNGIMPHVMGNSGNMMFNIPTKGLKNE